MGAPSLSFYGEGQSVQLRDRRRTTEMKGGEAGIASYPKGVRTEQDGSPA